jgi:hypothetical protein
LSYSDIQSGTLIAIFHSNKNDTSGVIKTIIAKTINIDCLQNDFLKLNSKFTKYPYISIGVMNNPIEPKNCMIFITLIDTPEERSYGGKHRLTPSSNDK